jgi:hypothetical protein
MFLPYISITDFTDPAQVARMQRVFVDAGGLAAGRKLGVGVMMSHKTLRGLETKWAKAFPPNDRIAEIFEACDPDISVPVLHYADYDGVDVKASLTQAIELSGPKLAYVQLDMIWPDANTLAEVTYAKRHSGFRGFILQVGEKAMEQEGHDPERVFRRFMALYKSMPAAVLLDRSMGRGKGMDAEALLKFAHAWQKTYPGSQTMGPELIVAGGLGPSTMNLLEPIVRVFPDVSIDAQGRLRPSGDALDPIDWNMAEDYLRAALELIGRNPWRSFSQQGYRLVNLGRAAKFYVPMTKIGRTFREATVDDALAAFLVKEFGAYSRTLLPSYGFWKDDRARIHYDQCFCYTVAFVGKHRIEGLLQCLGELCAAIQEECLYFEAGEDAALVYPAS